MLDAYIFRTIDEVRRKTGEWNVYYNYERPHESLSNMTPMEYSKRSAVNDPDVADRLYAKVAPVIRSVKAIQASFGRP